MTSNATAEVDEIVKGFPESLVEHINALLDDKNYTKKHAAIANLLQMGKSIVPRMHKLLSAKNNVLRKEVAKIIQLIADRRSIPFLINLLDDPMFDIRWIAAEGLIKIGRTCIVPLLKSIRDDTKSMFMDKGAHQVLSSLLNDNEKKQLEPLLLSLDNHLGLNETAPVEAAKALKTIFKSNH